MDKKATLTLADGKSLDFPVLSGSIGPEVIDIRTLYGKSGMFTYDPGFLSTASCQSAITYIDGDEGVLLYRGYPIEQLEGRITSVLLTPYPPGIPLLVPGERFNKTIVDYLKFARDFNARFPGFETDIHGLIDEKVGTETRYFVDCVR